MSDIEKQYKEAIRQAIYEGDNDLAYELSIGLTEYKKFYCGNIV